MAETLAAVDMLDTIGSIGPRVIPKGTKRVAVYITGSGGIPWSSQEIAQLQAKGVQVVLRIDQSNSVNTFAGLGLVVKDIEPGASTNTTAVLETIDRAKRGLKTVCYCMGSDFAALEAAIRNAGQEAHVFYWVADWNLDRPGAIAFLRQHPNVVAVQWASPSSNPHTLVPGSKLTLAQANVDLSVTRADWPAPLPPKKKSPLPRIPKPAKPKPKVMAALVTGGIVTGIQAVLHAHGIANWQPTPAESSGISVLAAIIAGYLTPSSKAP